MSAIEGHIPRTSLQSEVVARLRSEIVEGVWRPGDRLHERLLCARYGISRSPLREAYQVLAAEGLLDLTLNRGAVVSTPTVELTLLQFELLRTLEMLGVELACRRASDAEIEAIDQANEAMKRAGGTGDVSAYLHLNNEVHRAIVAASGNRPLIDAHQLVSRHIIRLQNLNGPLEHRVDESDQEHDSLIAALKARDGRRAVFRHRAHLKTVEDNLRRRLEPFRPL
jgi:DNA-binding GntR family transcriptional regulator